MKINHKLEQFALMAFRRITRMHRIEVVTVVFLLLAFAIIFTTFKYTVVEHEYYANLAEKQQSIVVKNPVSRGTVYSNNDPVGVFATSTDLPDLAIDPKAPGSKTRLLAFLTETVFLDLCSKQIDQKCRDGISDFVRFDRDKELPDSIDALKGLLRTELSRRIEKQYVDFVLVKESLTPEETKECQSLGFSWVTIVMNNLYVDPTALSDDVRSVLSAKFQSLFSMPKNEADFKLAKRPIRYLKLIRRMNLGTKDFIDAKLKEEKSVIAQGRLLESEWIADFIILEPHPTRFYPEKNIAGQVMGFVDNEATGRYGIEGYFNDELQWQEGERTTKKDAAGRTIGGYDLSERQIVNGADIKLTIDRNIQKEVSRLLEEGIKEFRANKGSVVVMDPKTGAVVAMANYPDYDPNEFASVYELEKVNYARYPNPVFDLLGYPLFVEDSVEGKEYVYDGRKIFLRTATEKETGNPAVPKYKFKNGFGPGVYQNDSISALYEPGSVFKALTTAIGIDTGDIRPSDTYYDKGFAEIDNFKIKNVSKECIGRHTYVHALDWSCNVGMIDIVQKIGKSLFYKYIQDFGIGAKSNITLEGEVFGKIDPYEKWARAKLFTMSFGQGVTATVLQMAAAYSVLANGGIYMEPYIVDSITLWDGTVIKNTPKPLRRVIKEETSKTITAMLTEGAKIGFAKKGSVDGYDTAGKTGTSQIASKGGYEEGGAGHTVTSYGGFAPSSNPKFVMIVKIDRPRSAEYSETTSSAMFAKISKYLLNYYGIPKNQ